MSLISTTIKQSAKLIGKHLTKDAIKKTAKNIAVNTATNKINNTINHKAYQMYHNTTNKLKNEAESIKNPIRTIQYELMSEASKIHQGQPLTKQQPSVSYTQLYNSMPNTVDSKLQYSIMNQTQQIMDNTNSYNINSHNNSIAYTNQASTIRNQELKNRRYK